MSFCFFRHFALLHYQVSGSSWLLDKTKNCSELTNTNTLKVIIISLRTYHVDSWNPSDVFIGFKKKKKMEKNFSQEWNFTKLMNTNTLKVLIISLRTHHVDSTLKRCGNDRFHVVSTWNSHDVFIGFKK